MRARLDRAPALSISREEIGEEWPLTVASGTLRCYQGYGIVFVAPGVRRRRYAVNGTAKSTGKFREIDEIWADDPLVEGAKISLGPILERGLELCRGAPLAMLACKDRDVSDPPDRGLWRPDGER